MASAGAEKFLRLTDVIEEKRWLRLQDCFSNVLGMLVRTVSSSRDLLVEPSWGSLRQPTESLIDGLRIGDELESLLPFQNPPKTVSILTVPLGLTYALVPIHLRTGVERLVAYFIIGPAIVGVRENESQFCKRAEALGLNADRIWPLLLFLRSYTHSGFRQAIELLDEVGSSLIEFAYQLHPSHLALASSTLAVEARHVTRRDRLLKVLLDAAVKCTGADGGSVMLYTPAGDRLTIAAAVGLSDQVVAQTCSRRGEGIAGVVARECSIRIIDKTHAQERFKSLMQRPELVSSLVASLIPEANQEPIGVLNLRTSRLESRFTQDHVELLRRLLDLASTALSSLSPLSSSKANPCAQS